MREPRKHPARFLIFTDSKPRIHHILLRKRTGEAPDEKNRDIHALSEADRVSEHVLRQVIYFISFPVQMNIVR